MNKGLDRFKLKDFLNPPEVTEKGWFQKRGRVFESVLNRLLQKEGMEPSTSFRPSGEEIDGSFSIGDNCYLLEAKWHSSPIAASSLYEFKGKVDGKFLGTVGVFISMSGYSSCAIDALVSGKNLNLILFDLNDVLLIDDGKITFKEAVRVKRRHASTYGLPYYPLTDHFIKNRTHGNNPRTNSKENHWCIVVEHENDVGPIKILLERCGVIETHRVVWAGGKLVVPQYIEYLSANSNECIAVIITPLSETSFEKERISKLKEFSVDVLELPKEIEDWIDDYVSVAYHNAVACLSDFRGKIARRYASSADIEALLADNPDFESLIRKINGVLT